MNAIRPHVVRAAVILDFVRIQETGHSKRLPKDPTALRVFLILRPGPDRGTPSGGIPASRVRGAARASGA